MSSIQILVDDYQPSADSSNDEGVLQQAGNANDSSESELLTQLKQSYIDYFFSEYEPSIPKDGRNESIFPKISLKIETEIYEFSFDLDFFEQLCDVYILEGWKGIATLGDLINYQVGVDNNAEQYGGIDDFQATAAGVKLLPVGISTSPTSWNSMGLSGGVAPNDILRSEPKLWDHVGQFFKLTQNIIAIYIAETLNNIEKLAAERIISKTSITNIQIANTWAKYKIKFKITTQYGQYVTDKLPPDTKENDDKLNYIISDKELSDDLFKKLTELVNIKHDLDLYTKKIDYYKIEKFNAKNQSLRYAKVNPPYSVAESQRAIDSAEKEISLTSAKEGFEKLLSQEKILLKSSHPVGILIYGSLKKGFSQERMESLFGQTLNSLRTDLEKIAVGINPRESKVDSLIKFSSYSQSNLAIKDIIAFNLPAGGVELFVISTAVASFKDSGYLPFLAESNLVQVIQKNINTDSFEYVVGNHYLRTLILKLGEIEDEEKKWEDFWKTISKISSALSLAVLMTPVTAEAYPFLEGAAAIADVALLAYTVSTVIGSLEKNNDLMRQELANQDDYSTETLAKFGEIITIQKEFSENLTQEALKEVFNILVGQKLPIFKEYLIARNYYSDLETLVLD